MSIYLETDVQPEARCLACRGTGVSGSLPSDPDWCVECGGAGVACCGSALATLAHNIAIGAALTHTFYVGVEGKFISDGNGGIYMWIPNTIGRQSP